MDSTFYIVSFLILFGIIIFVLLFGGSLSFRNSFIGSLNVFLINKVPRIINQFLLLTVGQKKVERLNKLWVYSCESRNPFLQIFFIVLSSVSIIGFLYSSLSHIPGPYLSRIHLVIIPIQIISLYVLYYLACTSNPGIITPENLQKHLDYYPYDYLIFKPKQCQTCQLQKPARSKHCSLCKACIGKSDHHCAWINRCVGENNQRYFFGFLFCLVELCGYGAYLCFQLYRGFIIEWGLDKAYVYNKKTGERSLISFRRSFLYVLHRDKVIGSIGILAAVVSVVVFVFSVHQLYLATRGITTNESFKWEYVEDAIDRGEIYKIVKKPLGQTTALDSSSSKKDETEKVRIKSLEEIDNIYDKGFKANLKEIFMPPKF